MHEVVLIRKPKDEIKDEIREVVNEQVREVFREEFAQWMGGQRGATGGGMPQVMAQPGSSQLGGAAQQPGSLQTGAAIQAQAAPLQGQGTAGGVPLQGGPSQAQVQALEQAETQIMRELQLNLQKLNQVIGESQQIARKIEQILGDQKGQGKGKGQT